MSFTKEDVAMICDAVFPPFSFSKKIAQEMGVCAASVIQWLFQGERSKEMLDVNIFRDPIPLIFLSKEERKMAEKVLVERGVLTKTISGYIFNFEALKFAGRINVNSIHLPDFGQEWKELWAAYVNYIYHRDPRKNELFFREQIDFCNRVGEEESKKALKAAPEKGWWRLFVPYERKTRDVSRNAGTLNQTSKEKGGEEASKEQFQFNFE